MTKIQFKSPILLSNPDSKPNFETISPLLNAGFRKGDSEGMEKWILEIICSLRVSPEFIEKGIEIYMDKDLHMMGILPIKKIFIDKIDDFDCECEHLWYIKTEEFDLDEFYNILDVSINDNPTSGGKKRGGRTVGIYTSLSKL